MGWPSKIYCATKTLGVYYTGTFNGTDQPTWVAVNGGLPATDVRQFALDPFTPETKQYCLLEASRDLYRRDNGGNWASVLTSAAAIILCGVERGWLELFCTDPSVPGRLWTSLNHTSAAGGHCALFALWSDDYGANWSATVQIYYEGWYDVFAGISGPQSYGDFVCIGHQIQSGADAIEVSTDKGATWTLVGVHSLSGRFQPLSLNALQPDRVYHMDGYVDNTCTDYHLANLDVFNRPDAIWFSAIAAGHHRAIGHGGEIDATVDSWANKTSGGAVAPVPVSFAPWAGADEDQMIVGLLIHDDPGQPDDNPHVIGCLYGEADVTATGIAGTNCETTPFTDSIPDTCGGVSIWGVQGVLQAASEEPVPDDDEVIDDPPITLDGIAYVQAVTMPGYTGDNRGEPLPGDRSAWKTDTEPHGQLHAQDITHEEAKYHLPYWDAANGEAPIFNSTTGFWEPADVLTPAEHTAIGDGAPHHAEVTLAASAAVLMDLAGQAISLDVQDAKKALMGPVSGAAAAPTFRVLANTDLPDPLGFALAATPLTIAAGAVTVTRSLHTLTSQAGLADDLDTITAAGDRTLLLLQATATHTITIKHGTGNISLNGAADFVLSGEKTLLLFWNGTKWVDVGAGGGALADHDHSGHAGDGGTFDAANLTSGASTDGQVLTSDGAGGAAWETPPTVTTYWEPTIAVVAAGDPHLIFTGDDDIVMVEVPI